MASGKLRVPPELVPFKWRHGGGVAPVRVGSEFKRNQAYTLAILRAQQASPSSTSLESSSSSGIESTPQDDRFNELADLCRIVEAPSVRPPPSPDKAEPRPAVRSKWYHYAYKSRLGVRPFRRKICRRRERKSELRKRRRKANISVKRLCRRLASRLKPQFREPKSKEAILKLLRSAARRSRPRNSRILCHKLEEEGEEAGAAATATTRDSERVDLNTCRSSSLIKRLKSNSTANIRLDESSIGYGSPRQQLDAACRSVDLSEASRIAELGDQSVEIYQNLKRLGELVCELKMKLDGQEAAVEAEATAMETAATTSAIQAETRPDGSKENEAETTLNGLTPVEIPVVREPPIQEAPQTSGLKSKSHNEIQADKSDKPADAKASKSETNFETIQKVGVVIKLQKATSKVEPQKQQPKTARLESADSFSDKNFSDSPDLSTSTRNLIDTPSRADWIESGTSKIGVRFERLLKRYKHLSRQKKYLYLILYLLAFLLIVSLIVLVIFLFCGTRTQLVYLKSVETNHTIFLNATTPSTISTTTTTTVAMTTSNSTAKSPGLVGDLCSKVFGDCDKFMECKKIGVHWNISHCQCIPGYQMDEQRSCRGLDHSFCESNEDCHRNLLCDLAKKSCKCKPGYFQREDKTCFAKYNSSCETDEDCLRNGECVDISPPSNNSNVTTNGHAKRVCVCSTKKRTVYRPNNHPYYQCKTLIGSSCEINNDCIENAKCNKYCSCRETDLYSETKDFFCEDLCLNKTTIFKNGSPIKFAHPRKCGFYYTCSPRDLDICPSKYSFDFESQSCNSSFLC